MRAYKTSKAVTDEMIARCLQLNREANRNVKLVVRRKIGKKIAKYRQMEIMCALVAGAPVYSMENCVDNAVLSVYERVLMDKRDGDYFLPVQPTENFFRTCRAVFRKVVNALPPTPVISYDQFILGYEDGRKRAIYTKARDSLLADGVRQKDFELNSFVKYEKYTEAAGGKEAAVAIPRPIQPRTPRAIMALGVFIKPMEKPIIKALNLAFDASGRIKTIFKGLNANERGAEIKKAWDEFDDPVAVGVDGRHFDKHVNVSALRFEHAVYLHQHPNNKSLKRMLNWQLHNKGVFRCEDGSVHYEVDGNRMSGDINTSLGNIIIMCCLLWTFLTRLLIKFRVVDDGDDAVIIVERRDLRRLDGLHAYGLTLGFDLKLEEPVYVLEHVEFCRSHPVNTGSGWKMVRNLEQSLIKDQLHLIPTRTEEEWNHMRKAVSDCGAALADDVPILREFYRALGRGAKLSKKQYYKALTGMDFLARGATSGDVITTEARVSFWRAFGVLPDHQVAREKELSRLTPLYRPDRLYREGFIPCGPELVGA